MAELAAQQKYSCPACGGEAVWRADKQKLVCAFCGAESPMAKPHSGLAEHAAFPKYNLDASLAEHVAAGVAPETAGRITVQCQSCKAISEFAQGQVAERCQFCGAAEIVPYNALADRFHPESVLPFKIDRNAARDALQTWYGRVWLAPNALAKQARLDTYTGVYIPHWMFDANATATWQGKGTAFGTVKKNYVDFPVPAAGGVDRDLLRKLAPFPTHSLLAYDTQYVAGFTVERYQVQLKDGVAQAHEWMKDDLLDQAKSQAMVNRSDVRIDSAGFEQQLFRLTLLPIWLLTYRYGGKPYHVTVNGATGEVAGNHPYSKIKVALVFIVCAEIFLFTQDAEFAIRLPIWLVEGLWRLIRMPFVS
jgi:predicted RNA-binding Zn-ribbon protein involved in translation (DUF1610 family)